MYELHITLVPHSANKHCRFLIDGDKGTVLHTGDFRAEPCFLDRLLLNPLLKPYLASSTDACSVTPKTLEAIYLDTACLLSALVIPTKVLCLPLLCSLL